MTQQEIKAAMILAVRLSIKVLVLVASLVYIGSVGYLALFAPEYLNNISALPIIGIVLGAAVAYIATESLTRLSEGDREKGHMLKVTLPGIEFQTEGGGQYFFYAVIFLIATASYFFILTRLTAASG